MWRHSQKHSLADTTYTGHNTHTFFYATGVCNSSFSILGIIDVQTVLILAISFASPMNEVISAIMSSASLNCCFGIVDLGFSIVSMVAIHSALTLEPRVHIAIDHVRCGVLKYSIARDLDGAQVLIHDPPDANHTRSCNGSTPHPTALVGRTSPSTQYGLQPSWTGLPPVAPSTWLWRSQACSTGCSAWPSPLPTRSCSSSFPLRVRPPGPCTS